MPIAIVPRSKKKPAHTQQHPSVDMSQSIKDSVNEAFVNTVEIANEYLTTFSSFNKEQFQKLSNIDVVHYVQPSTVALYIKTLSTDKIVSDIKEFKVTPVNVSIGIAILTSIYVVYSLTLTDKRPKKTKKKLTKAQRANRDIQRILEYVEKTYVPAIDNYDEQFDELKEDDQVYKYNYISEMLLKETLKLDEIDAGTNDVLRSNRRKVIQYIQDHQKRLDKIKLKIAA